MLITKLIIVELLNLNVQEHKLFLHCLYVCVMNVVRSMMVLLNDRVQEGYLYVFCGIMA
jgi:hypothetical protein